MSTPIFSIAGMTHPVGMAGRFGQNFAGWPLSLVLLFMVPSPVRAQFNYATNDGTITITSYTGSGGDVAIPDTINGLPVTSIGMNAFYNQASVTSVAIPNSVTQVGQQAFVSCSGLTNVVIGSGVTNFGYQAFTYCSSLQAFTVDALNPVYTSEAGVLFANNRTTLVQYPAGKGGSYVIPTGVTNIGFQAFVGSAGLSGVVIPNTVTSIEGQAFYSCTSLTTIAIPDSVTNSVYQAFLFCSSLTNATVGSGVTSLDGTFSDCPSLASITIGESVTNLGGTFVRCTGLTSVTIPSSVTIIGDMAFAGCTGLTSVNIPMGAISLGDSAFGNCIGLTGLTIPSSITHIGDWTFSRAGLTSLTIPNNVTNIGSYAFYYCQSLTSITIPNSITDVGDSAFAYSGLTRVMLGDSVANIQSYAFYYCTNLTAAYFGGNAPSLGSGVFDNDDHATIYHLPGTTGWSSTLGGRPTVPWNPQVQTNAGSFGMRTNQFGFNIAGTSNLVIVVEACTDLSQPVWQSVQTNKLTSGSAYFNDPQSMNYPARFYRLRSE
jgi:hypothetical protein